MNNGIDQFMPTMAGNANIGDSLQESQVLNDKVDYVEEIKKLKTYLTIGNYQKALA